jgi:hypothetical protein
MKHFNVDWRTVPYEMKTATEINEFLDKAKVKLTKPDNGKTITSFVKIRDKFYRIGDNFYGFSDQFGYFRLGRTANDEVFEENGISAGDAFAELEKLFEEYNNITLKRAFGPTNHHKEYWAVKRCVPSPINWASRMWGERKLINVKKADVSSAYPTELSKRVPTWKGCEIVEGEVEPNKDFPFAFYSNRHVKVLEENGEIISTYELQKSEYYMTNLKKKCGDEYIDRFVDERPHTTILCKTSEYSFAPIMKKLYEERNLDEEHKKRNKAIMNLSIGMFHRSKSPMYSNIAAVVLLRCSLNMERRLRTLEKKKCCPILVNTDSIAWLGDDVSLANKEKFLGSFYLEHENCEMYIVSSKCYQLKDNDEVITHWAGKKGVKHANIPFGNLPKDALGDGYFWDDKTERYIIKEVCIL